MFLSVGIVSLALYYAQQLGVALAVSAETILLVAYLISIRDGKISEKESHIARAVQNVLFIGVVLIITSGIVITLMHIADSQSATVYSPAYLFKCALIVLALFLGAGWYKLPQAIIDGLAGGTWYALFMVHILAPDTNWFGLLSLYAVWMVGFMLCWEALVYFMSPRAPSVPAAAAPMPVPPKPVAAPAPAAVPPQIKQAPPPTATQTPAPMPKPAQASTQPTQTVSASQKAANDSYGASALAPTALAHLRFPEVQEPPPMPGVSAAQPTIARVPQTAAPMSLANKPATPTTQTASSEPSGLSAFHVMPKSPEAISKNAVNQSKA